MSRRNGSIALGLAAATMLGLVLLSHASGLQIALLGLLVFTATDAWLERTP